MTVQLSVAFGLQLLYSRLARLQVGGWLTSSCPTLELVVFYQKPSVAKIRYLELPFATVDIYGVLDRYGLSLLSPKLRLMFS
jgi:hypothetical protein